MQIDIATHSGEKVHCSTYGKSNSLAMQHDHISSLRRISMN